MKIHNMKKYRVGIIGCGRIGSLLEDDPLRGKPCTHAGAVYQSPCTELITGCDIDQECLRSFGKRWKTNRLYTDYKEMLHKEELDIVCIAAWTHLHAEMAIAASEAGVKGIYCEKPIALTLEQADTMLEVCRQLGVKIVVGHERRWDSHFQKARELIQEGVLGDIHTVIGNALSEAPHPHPVNIMGGGPLFHDGTHLTDLLRFFVGEVDWVIGHDERPHGEQYIEHTALGFLHFRNGAHGIIEGGGKREYFNFELDLQGSQGRLLIGNGVLQLSLAKPSQRYSGFVELTPRDFPHPEKSLNAFVEGLRDLIRCIEEDAESISSGHDGRSALEIILAIYKSASLGGQQVHLPLNSN